ncbi:hypothetical protein OG897_08250 [Streptomyces sp. NBC_00237]|uniref:hypothetical protein n=1 Tax=Streptomyces sp. NBC_00237 TaxID=2975687 RepID=UPI0022580685|nr:hypothetical protein [Streptomyces sp. NBC_00237]MCX5201443.1 hypothetical protein [Streptomyces sp. NBC_00237]
MLKRTGTGTGTGVRGGARAAVLAAAAGLVLAGAALPSSAAERVAFGDAAPWLCNPADERDDEASALACHKKRALGGIYRARTANYFVMPENKAAADAALAEAEAAYKEVEAATTAVAAAQAAAKVADAANRVAQVAVAKTPEALKQAQDAWAQASRSAAAVPTTTPPARDVDANNQADSDEDAAVFLMEAAGWILG